MVLESALRNEAFGLTPVLVVSAMYVNLHQRLSMFLYFVNTTQYIFHNQELTFILLIAINERITCFFCIVHQHGTMHQ